MRETARERAGARWKTLTKVRLVRAWTTHRGSVPGAASGGREAGRASGE